MSSRKERLRQKLKARNASLADDFEYRCFVLFFPKGSKNASQVFECERVGLSMTNDQEHAIMEGVRSNAYSQDEADMLLTRDTVQIHAARWFELESKELDATTNINMVIWPAPHRHRMEVLCFSRWKSDSKQGGEGLRYQLLQSPFCMYQDIECSRNPLRFLISGDKRAGIFFNFAQNLGLWINPHEDNSSSCVRMCMCSMMLCFAQDVLTDWSETITISGGEVMTLEKTNELYHMCDWAEMHAELCVQPKEPLTLAEREALYRESVQDMKGAIPKQDQFAWMKDTKEEGGDDKKSSSVDASSRFSGSTKDKPSISSSPAKPVASFADMAASSLSSGSSASSSANSSSSSGKNKGKGKGKGKKGKGKKKK
jgi:hypothetical protein